jgi:hypothetical protein
MLAKQDSIKVEVSQEEPTAKELFRELRRSLSQEDDLRRVIGDFGEIGDLAGSS